MFNPNMSKQGILRFQISHFSVLNMLHQLADLISPVILTSCSIDPSDAALPRPRRISVLGFSPSELLYRPFPFFTIVLLDRGSL